MEETYRWCAYNWMEGLDPQHRIEYYDPKECSKRSGNLINRKNTIFYIEIISQFFSQLQKNRDKKIIFEKSIFFEIIQNRNFENFQIFEKK